MLPALMLIVQLAVIPPSKQDAEAKVVQRAVNKLGSLVPFTKEQIIAWTVLRKGMTKKQVEALLGRPGSTISAGGRLLCSHPLIRQK
jgi:outer membrane protein assembly factor BamE (lipoprotein component of BamABCDE complex)